MKWLLASVAVLAGIACINADCGRPEVQGSRVIAGQPAARGAWPWQILMFYDGNMGCGGTLIAPNWVITAAHCVYGKEWYPRRFTVRVGEHDFNRVEGSEVDHQVERVFRHPNYNPRTFENDIAIFKLARPVKYNRFVKPACLPSGVVSVGSSCYITGWGKIHHPGQMYHLLQQAVLKVPSNQVCDAKNWRGIGIHVRPSMICGGDGGRTRVGGCHGDSGGPFVCNIGGRWELHGSVSHGSSDCQSYKSYTVFSRTSYLLGWVKQVTGVY